MASLIEDYALLGDLHTAALVGKDGSVDWLCLPRFDSSACFASLVGTEDNGFWRIAPTSGGTCTRRRYRGDTLVLETEWETCGGTVRVVDAMPPRGEAADLVRIVQGVSGKVRMRVDLRLRFDYGNIVPWMHRPKGDDSHGRLVGVAGPDSVWIDTPVELHGEHLTSCAEFEVTEGDDVPFVLTYAPSYDPPPPPVNPHHAVRDTEKFWTDWMSSFRYDGKWDSAVRRSLITLKALTYRPTGGIVAAATTSLPEQLGGPRNWDYRFCWLRDATFTLQALMGTGFDSEAKEWREWLLRAVAGDPADLQIMYGIEGHRRLPEFTLDWLDGYEGSRPVRVGNAASKQLQLDVWGEVLDGLHVSREAGLAPEESAWDLQCALLEYLEGGWDQPDNGLWEMRGPRQQFVHSKVMAWAGFDRGVQAIERFGREGPLDKWMSIRAQIHDQVCQKGYDSDRHTFTQFYGSKGLDAALLMIPRVGFLPWDDERVVGTVDAVQRELCQDGFVLRYRPEADDADGLPGTEGSFLACTFWLASALHGIGRHDEGEQLFERLLDLRNDVGLLSEEYDGSCQRALGNTPQAYSHVGLVNTARHLSGAEPAWAQEQESKHDG
ncbi:MAG TPA: glycoside hydrolase family 15 protein [Actinomycetales bacterium]|nr:glycoside hydrolase family 15 protein [Actinomycetales bacterium]